MSNPAAEHTTPHSVGAADFGNGEFELKQAQVDGFARDGFVVVEQIIGPGPAPPSSPVRSATHGSPTAPSPG
jgi:hypothetical protein